MSTKKVSTAKRSNDEVRLLVLRYFYERNHQATSARGKKGFSIKMSSIKKDLKASSGLTQPEVVSNLNYLISQGWIAEEHVQKSVPLPSGTVIPQITSFYKITAAGIDKIEGPGDFTMDKFAGIKIEATGQNIITVGDGNQVNAAYKDAAGALSELKHAIVASVELGDAEKLDAVADIDSIQSQLAKQNPNSSTIGGLWEGLSRLATIATLTDTVAKAAALLGPFLS